MPEPLISVGEGNGFIVCGRGLEAYRARRDWVLWVWKQQPSKIEASTFQRRALPMHKHPKIFAALVMKLTRKIP